MAKIIQIRDVPDEVHDALAAAARAEQLSLNRFVLRELAHVARRAQRAAANARVIAETRSKVGARLTREQVLEALDDGRHR